MKKTTTRGFGSDNHAPIHPKILASLSEVNSGHYPSYGNDPWTEAVQECFQKHFGPHTESSFVFNGTAANTLILKAGLQSYQACFCSDISHLYWDECGAPEFIAGTKLIPLPSYNGKIRPESLDEYWIRRGDQHYSQVQMISITQPTEVGTVYTVEELKVIIAWAKSHQLLVHMDGARLANAAVSLNLPFIEFTTHLGVDMVSFGGSKNGFMLGEAVLFLNPNAYNKTAAPIAPLSKNFKFIRKQCLQLPSKSRFIAAQFLAYFKDDLWREIATHSCLYAKKLEAEILNQEHKLKIVYPVQSNAVFVQIPKKLFKPLRDKYFFYVWNEHDFTCRMMISWDTQEEEILGFSNLFRDLSLTIKV